MKAQKLTLAGSIFTAVMASSCCWLPFALLAFGISGTAFSSILNNYRIHFLVITYIFLSIAFYFAYKPIKNDSKSGDTCCEPKAKKKMNLKSINRFLLWVTTVLVTALAFLPTYMHLLPFYYPKVTSVKSLYNTGNEDKALIFKLENHENYLLRQAKCCDKKYNK